MLKAIRMPIPSGIPNTGNICYASSVTQCIRRIVGSDFSIDTSTMGDGPKDASEYYMELVEGDTSLHGYFGMKMKGQATLDDSQSVGSKSYDRGDDSQDAGTYETYLVLIDSDGNSQMDDLVQHRGNIVAYRVYPSKMAIKDMAALNTGSEHMNLVAAICYHSGHYFSLVEWGDIWYLYNDDRIYKLGHPQGKWSEHEYRVSMMFYQS